MNGTYYNEDNGMTVRIVACEFYVIGNRPELVSDLELCELSKGNVPEGWVNQKELIKAAIAAEA